MKDICRVSIVFVNWNGKANVEMLLDSVLSLDFKIKLSIICVDNGSKDGSQDLIRKKFKKLESRGVSCQLVELENNIGISRACNIGFREAIRIGAEFVWRLDNDIVLDTESLNSLLKEINKSKNIGIVGSVVFPLVNSESLKNNLKYKCEIGCKISFLTASIFKNMSTYEKIKKLDNLYTDVDYSIGCSNLIRKEVFDKNGFLDEDFFLYYDDSYFSYLAKRNGFIIGTNPKSIVFHKGSASTGGIMKPLGIYYTTLSELLFFKKIMGKSTFNFYLPFIVLKRLCLTMFRMSKYKSINYLYEGAVSFFKANIQFFRNFNI